jgi:hypothetical protein
MAGSTARTAPGQDSRFASARAEIDDFMRRFLAYAKTDNAAARAAPKIVLRDGQLTSADLTKALEKLDILCSRLDVEATNVIQIEIQNEALKSLHQDRVRRHAQTLQELEKARLSFETRCRELELRLRVATKVGGRLGPAKLTRLLEREKRTSRRFAVRRRLEATRRPETLIAAE